MSQSEKTIVVIGLSTLEYLGLKEIVHQEWDGRIQFFHSMEFPFKEIETYSAFIISSDVFTLFPDVFMPRRQKTLIVCRGYDIKTKGNENGFLNVFRDELDIKEEIKILLKNIDDNKQERGELSTREIEVLRLVASGKLNKEIADSLFISVNTVITHRKNIASKLGIRSASALTTYALMNGII